MSILLSIYVLHLYLDFGAFGRYIGILLHLILRRILRTRIPFGADCCILNFFLKLHFLASHREHRKGVTACQHINFSTFQRKFESNGLVAKM